MYYNTTESTGNELKTFKDKSEKTEALILKWFNENPLHQLTPYEMLDRIYNGNLLKIHSVKRAMSDLTDAGKLIKLPTMKIERTGRPNHLWSLRIEYGQQKLNL
jgi:hypothetical protein